MLNSTKIEIFKSLTRSTTISELSTILELNHSTISKAVNSLKKDGFVVKQKEGKQVYVNRSDSLHSQSLGDIIIEYPRLPLSKILTSSSLHILSVLENPRSIINVAAITGLNRQTVSSTIHELAKYGIVLKKKSKYIFSERHSLIKNFVDNYWKYVANRNLRTISENTVLLWQRGPEFLFKIDNEFDKNQKKNKKTTLHPTAINLFHKYSLRVMSDTRYYFYTKRKLKAEDCFIHTILIDPHSSIYNSYALALLSKIPSTELVKFGKYYDIEDHIKTLLEYVDTKQKNSDFVLPWNEYNDLVKDLE
jgi:predicted transcriptional regulator